MEALKCEPEALKSELEALETDKKALKSELEAFSKVDRGPEIRTPRGLSTKVSDLAYLARGLVLTNKLVLDCT